MRNTILMAFLPARDVARAAGKTVDPKPTQPVES